MINKIRDTFQLTEKGAKGLIKGSISSFVLYFGYMLPIMLIMMFIEDVVEDTLKSPMYYTVAAVIVAVVLFLVIYINYNTVYKETYIESKNLRIDIANILKDLPLSYFSNHDVADLSQTVMKDVESIEHALSHALPQAIGMVMFLVVVSISMLLNNFKLALCIILPIALSFFLLLVSKKMQIKGSTKYFNKLRDNSDKFQEAIELQQEIKSYGQSESIKKSLKKEMEASEKIHISSELGSAIPLLLSGTALKFAIGLTILVGASLYVSGSLSMVLFLGYVIGSAKIIFTVENLQQNVSEIMYIDSRVSRIRELRETEIQVGKKTNLEKYDIELKDVEFSYNDDTKVIKGVSFTAKQNEVTALVGPSGCGKTSILRLMSRLYDYDKGQIIIDGHDIKNVDTDSLFDKISIVFQDVMLFNTSVMENIRMGNRNATDEEVKKAAELANCTEFIDKLPQGYNTDVGENGGNLSGGQRQRISIARAILKDAPIILLDEISASLDVENEMKIQESLNTLIKNKTVVIISHRLKSIENADKIVVMNAGKVEREGNHEDLMKNSKTYRTMIEKSNITENYVY